MHKKDLSILQNMGDKDSIFNDIEAHDYDKKVKDNDFFKKLDDFILDTISDDKQTKKKKLADICCGTGSVIELLYGDFRKITGIDASEEMIRIGKKRFRWKHKASLYIADAADTRIPDSSQDYTIMRMCLHHIHDKTSAIDEVSRITKPGGTFIYIDKYHAKGRKTIGKLYSHYQHKKQGKSEKMLMTYRQTKDLLSKDFECIKENTMPEGKSSIRNMLYHIYSSAWKKK